MPLQLVTLLGGLAAISGLLTGLYYAIRYMTNNITTPGYASIIVSILTLGGVQLLGLGVIGEYLGRLHMNVSGKPQYQVRQVRSNENNEQFGGSSGDHFDADGKDRVRAA